MPERTPRDPRAMGDLLGMFVKGRAGWSERMTLGRLRDGWSSVVGPAIAAHSAPVRLQRGVLTVRADAGAWATELTLLGRSVLAKIAEVIGDEVVRELSVTASEGDNP